MTKEGKKGQVKQQSPLGESLEKRLAVYALAAGAAGVGVRALAPPAQVEVVTRLL